MDLTKKVTLDVGDIFFINASDITSWTKVEGITALDDDYFDSGADKIVRKNKSNMLLLVKYLGNGVLEEMLTEEHLIINAIENSDTISDYHYNKENHSDNRKNFADNYSIVSNVEGFVFQSGGDVNIRSVDHVHLLTELKEKCLKYPMVYTIYEDFPGYVLNEDSKALYLKYTDEERVKEIKKIRTQARESTNKTVAEIDQIVKDEIFKYVMRVATLDNQIEDFKIKK